jgi:hypothetical protein
MPGKFSVVLDAIIPALIVFREESPLVEMVNPRKGEWATAK